MFDGAYPPGVTGKLVDQAFGTDINVEEGCWNCIHYNGSWCACTKEWNNMDESNYVPERDDVEEDGWCSDWELDEGSLEE